MDCPRNLDRFEELTIEWLFKLVFGVILLKVFFAIFLGFGALTGVGTPSDIVAQYVKLEALSSLVLCSSGLIVAAIMSSLKR